MKYSKGEHFNKLAAEYLGAKIILENPDSPNSWIVCYGFFDRKDNFLSDKRDGSISPNYYGTLEETLNKYTYDKLNEEYGSWNFNSLDRLSQIISKIKKDKKFLSVEISINIQQNYFIEIKTESKTAYKSFKSSGELFYEVLRDVLYEFLKSNE